MSYSDVVHVDEFRIFLDSRSDKCISASALMEVIVHFRDNTKLAKQLMDFIAKKKMKVYNNCQFYGFSDDEFTACVNMNVNDLYIYARGLLNKKIEIEESFSYVFLQTIMLVYTDYLIENSSIVDENVKSNLINMIGRDFAKSWRDERLQGLHDALIQGYEIGKEENVLKDKFMEYLSEDCVYSYMWVRTAEEFQGGATELIDVMRSAAVEAKNTGMNQNDAIKTISHELLQNPQIIQDTKDELVKIYLKKGFTCHQAGYIGAMFERWVVQKQKLRKNDIYDMLFMGSIDRNYYDASLPVVYDQSSYILTFDRKLVQFIYNENPLKCKMIIKFSKIDLLK